MPTGYTYPVVEGKITEFKDFALSCARAFGALIEMRDESMDAPLPEAIKPHTSHYDESIAKHEARLTELSAMTAEQTEAASAAAYNEAVAYREKYLAGKETETDRLTAMLRKVRAWSPPSPDHFEMKKFMIQQLETSLPGSYSPEMPVRLDGETWRSREIQRNAEGLAYDKKGRAEEIERANGRDAWLKNLRASLG